MHGLIHALIKGALLILDEALLTIKKPAGTT
jgi:hypothetical protein